LHPGWQRSVITDLENTFPNVQFIVTTHSPQVISKVKPESLVLLENTNAKGILAFGPSTGTFGRDTNQILENIFGVSDRPQKIKKEIQKYFQLIDKGNLIKADKLRKKLEKEIGADDPEFTRADALIRTREILGK
jgi:predicted ATP-binding protein involved in virulence